MNIGKALLHKWPGAQWTLNGEKYSGLVWNDHVYPKPTEAQLEAAWNDYIANALYAEKRRNDYEREIPMRDMIVALWEQVVEGRPEKANALQAKRADIKSRYPKGA